MSDYLAIAYYYGKWRIQEFFGGRDNIFKNWSLMDYSIFGSAITTAYVYFVKIAGPGLMRHRGPFHLREPMICYNLMMSMLNLALFLKIGRYGWFEKHNLYNKPALQISQLNYIFYLSKFVQFCDTIFLVMLKKNNISTLHILQRTLTPFLHWFSMNCAPGQQTNAFSLINTFLHTVMYTYYGMKLMKPDDRKILKYQKIIKNIQRIQMFTTIAHGVLLYIRNTRAMRKFLSSNFVPALIFLGLFINLFIDTFEGKFKKRESIITLEQSSSVEEQPFKGETKKRLTQEKPS